MKRLIFCLLVPLILSVTAGRVLAQGAQAEMVKQRALKERDANNVRQGITPGGSSSSSAPSAPPPGPAAPDPVAGPRAINTAQQQVIDKLELDLTAIKPGVDVTTDQQQQLQGDFIELCKAGTKPAKSTVGKLATDLSAALANKSVTGKDQAQMAKNINVLMNSATLSPDQVKTAITLVQSALRTSGAATAEIDTIGADLKAISKELQKSKPKLFD